MPLIILSQLISFNIHITRYIYIYNRPIGIMVNAHQWTGRLRFNLRSSYTKDSKIELDNSLLNTQHFIRCRSRVSKAILGKELQLTQHLSVVSIEKEAIWSPSTTVGQLTLLIYIYIYIYIYIITNSLGKIQLCWMTLVYSLIVWDTVVQSQIESYQRFKKCTWCLLA